MRTNSFQLHFLITFICLCISFCSLFLSLSLFSLMFWKNIKFFVQILADSFTWIILRMSAYSARNPKLWMMQDTTQVSTAVRPWDGELQKGECLWQSWRCYQAPGTRWEGGEEAWSLDKLNVRFWDRRVDRGGYWWPPVSFTFLLSSIRRN